MGLKQIVITRKDLKLPKGKFAVVVSHASLEAALRSPPDIREEWRREGAKKVVVKVENLKELMHYREMADSKGLVNALITDAGRTTVAPGTIVSLAIGPDDEEKIDKITADLKLV